MTEPTVAAGAGRTRGVDHQRLAVETDVCQVAVEPGQRRVPGAPDKISGHVLRPSLRRCDLVVRNFDDSIRVRDSIQVLDFMEVDEGPTFTTATPLTVPGILECTADYRPYTPSG
jgi:hypothetical protein